MKFYNNKGESLERMSPSNRWMKSHIHYLYKREVRFNARKDQSGDCDLELIPPAAVHGHYKKIFGFIGLIVSEYLQEHTSQVLTSQLKKWYDCRTQIRKIPEICIGYIQHSLSSVNVS